MKKETYINENQSKVVQDKKGKNSMNISPSIKKMIKRAKAKFAQPILLL